MNWLTEVLPSEHTLHSSHCTDVELPAIQAALQICADFSFAMLDENIVSDSMYCLFIWNTEKLSLRVVVTDESKTVDSVHIVEMTLQAFKNDGAEELADTVKFWLTDYLTTCPEFLSFSLLAGFVRAERDRVELM